MQAFAAGLLGRLPRLEKIPGAFMVPLLSFEAVPDVPSIDFRGVISDEFRIYRLNLIGVRPAADGAKTLLRASINNGATWLAGTEYFSGRVSNASSAATPTGAADSSASSLSITDGVGNAVGRFMCAELTIHRLPTNAITVHWSSTTINETGAIVNNTGNGLVSGVNINALQILMATGNIATASAAALFGVRSG